MTPIIKNSNHSNEDTIKGEIPITKNVKVVDEFGNEYEATYLKRAKQLVKKGRAHFIDSFTISLVCPPKPLEDKNMSEDKKELTQEYILDKIDQILSSTDHIKQALIEISNIPESKGPGDVSGGAKADAIAQVVRYREETNHQLISLLTTMHRTLDEDNLKKKQALTLLEYADDPEAFENAKEALSFLK